MAGIKIDFSTLVLALATLYVIQATILIVLYSAHRKYVPTLYWAQGAIATAMGAVAFILRGHMSEVISVIVSNALLVGGAALQTGGLMITCGRRPPWLAAFLMWAAYMLATLWCYYAVPSFPARVALFHLALTLVLTVELFALMMPAAKTEISARWLIAVGTLLVLLPGLFRGVSILFDPDQFTPASNLFVWFGLVRCFTQTSGCTMLVGAHYQGELERLSRLDPLTGLLNRRAFDEIADRLWAQANRMGWPMAFLMVDIDHFKLVNDRFGHATGDAVLRDVGEVLRHGLREDDLVARLGGEEFAVVLPNTDNAHAITLAERIRSACSKLALPDGSFFTISIGIADRGEGDGEWRPLLRQADHALYQAKELGRDRVVTLDHIIPGDATGPNADPAPSNPPDISASRQILP